MIPAVILAAGSGRRMGGPKALLCLGGETLLRRAARVALEAGCNPVLAVIGTWDPELEGLDVQCLVNPLADEGMASSIRAGVAALPDGAEAVLLLTVDQPSVDASLLRRLMDLATTAPERPVACAYAGTLGVPAVIPRRLFTALQDLRGDRGAKAILLQEDALTLPFTGGEADLDRPEDLALFKR